MFRRQGSEWKVAVAVLGSQFNFILSRLTFFLLGITEDESLSLECLQFSFPMIDSLPKGYSQQKVGIRTIDISHSTTSSMFLFYFPLNANVRLSGKEFVRW